MRRAVSKRLRRLVERMEAEGYEIGLDLRGKGVHIKFPDGPVPDICGMIRLNLAREEDPELNAAFLPWLRRNRPYAHLLQRLARN